MEVQPKIEEGAILIDDDDEIPVQKAHSVTYNYIPAPGKTPFDTQLRLCKQKQLSQDEDPESTILRRLVKFYEYNKKIQPGNEYFTTRKEPNNESDLIENELIIFGCDFKKLKLVKKEYETNRSVIINPSNFKLIYSDRGSAWKAISENAKDPQQLVNKRQQEDDPLPRCWIEMKPYSFHNSPIKVFVRFATEAERNIEPMKQEWSYIYNKCKDAFNAQQQEKKQRQQQNIERKKQKLETQKQRNSNKLYERFQKQNGETWQKGKDTNPGAERQNSRSRSRSRGKAHQKESQKQANQDINDNKSSCSFIMNKRLNQINNALNEFQIVDDGSEKKSEVNLSFEMRAPNEGSEYQWSGKKGEGSTKYNWSYSEYTKKVEQEEQLRRRKKESKIPVVTIDD